MRLPPLAHRRPAGSRLLASLVLALLVAVPLLAGGSPARAAAAPQQPKLTVVLTSITPQAPKPGDTLDVTGTVTNSGSADVEQARVLLHLRRYPLTARSELPLADAGKGNFETPGPQLGPALDLGTVAAGSSLPFHISVPLDPAGLGGFGVYPMAIEARGSLPGGVRQQAGIQYTLLPWAPAGVAPTGVVWTIPLIDQPRRDAAGVFSDDALGESLAHGRLQRVLAIGTTAQSVDHVPLAWVVDPNLLDSVAAMAKGYRVRGADGKTVAGTHADDATAWLSALQAAVVGQPVIVLPYADPDLVALHRAELGADLSSARARGAEIAGRLLPGAQLVTDVGWPAEGYVDASTAADLPAYGISTLILDGNALRPSAQITYTPTGRAVLPGTGERLDALLTDPTLDTLVTTSGQALGQGTLAVQRFLGQTAFITAERPSRSRLMLIAPPRQWNPDPALLGTLLHATSTGTVPWLSAATLAQLRAAPQDDVLRQDLLYPKNVRSHELPRSYLYAATDLRRQLGVLASILDNPAPVTTPYEDAILRAESAAWRGSQLPAGRAYELQLRANVSAAVGQVHVVPGRVNFSAQRGRLPLTIVNDLDQPVTVQLQLTPHPARLRLLGDAPVLQLAPHRREQITVEAQAVAPGRVDVDAQLLTPEGALYGDPATIQVRVTTIGTLALVVTLAALAVLFGAAGVRIVRRVLGARRKDRSGAGEADDASRPAEGISQQ